MTTLMPPVSVNDYGARMPRWYHDSESASERHQATGEWWHSFSSFKEVDGHCRTRGHHWHPVRGCDHAMTCQCIAGQYSSGSDPFTSNNKRISMSYPSAHPSRDRLSSQWACEEAMPVASNAFFDTQAVSVPSLHCSEDDQAVVSVLGNILKSKLDVLRAMPPVQRTQLYAQLHLALVARQRGRARAERPVAPAHTQARPLTCPSAEMKRTRRLGGPYARKWDRPSRIERESACVDMMVTSRAFVQSQAPRLTTSSTTPISLPHFLRAVEHSASVPHGHNADTRMAVMVDTMPLGRLHAAAPPAERLAGGLKAHQQVLAAQEVQALVQVMAEKQSGNVVAAVHKNKGGCGDILSSLEDGLSSTSGGESLCTVPQVADKSIEVQSVGAKAVQVKLFGVEMTVHTQGCVDKARD